MNKVSVDLTGRRQPLQSRAKESVESILATAAVLLDEVGVEGFKTNLLAERAGVRVRTVYRYFPNKYSIIVAMTEAFAQQWDQWMADFYAVMTQPGSDWRAALKSTRAEWIRHARRVPGSMSVLQAINVTPELRELHVRIFDEMSRKLADALKARGVRLPAARLLAVARAIVTAQNASTETYLRLKGQEARQYLEEIFAIEEAYLKRYLQT